MDESRHILGPELWAQVNIAAYLYVHDGVYLLSSIRRCMCQLRLLWVAFFISRVVGTVTSMGRGFGGDIIIQKDIFVVLF